ncbi:5-methyltetrahydrofolate--homocysteine methyltransferase [Parabacteroides sp. PF5-5]|uniref:methionine synthase n=1 Tax=unclassified Parabacteroides TaxID=2649774 RepID=UPI002473123B|nr:MULTISPECIES: methionine synthase [unclassified Parabacteroides]MDH6305136.1 5-methyltetrahydrofolate--homocysteine methyltransferase [Parabacteroides sp. PH5-39]MDH6316486.1 5-methyltetrahydrofolate--homocysteine methyltransferase [Parabacteroides sp. PF5-13]MDH6319996.1 5-methyltetrahydrofolate--homocysteine methyltransferase [Parabacteroides sp. PH5-13]MDH6323771.1 5-methyltetrahydrofolate--homocysteine methyltransferase [Parabacteroides sp. PH5-8]MDH6327673.1 5-methyltetrahydrofolate--h
MKDKLQQLLKEKILILDGGMGTMIQRHKLSEQDYRGTRFADFPNDLKGNNDLLNITQPDIIAGIHRQYLDAGADIFATNTFNANAISMEDYGMQTLSREINLAAGQLSRKVADTFMAEHPDRIIFVAGSVGPTNKTASMSPDVSDPAYRTVTYKDLYIAYKEQIEALIEGGVDIILVETVFDTLNAKAALEAAETAIREQGKELPIMLSVTLSAQGGRTFSGQTLTAFLASVQHVNLVSIGLNCSFGAADMKPYLQELAQSAPYYISAYPNAGLPNSFGLYDETPETMAQHIKSFIDEGLVNILGGCCGTTPEHIAQYPALIKGAKPHQPVAAPQTLWLSGLELLEIKPENNFVNIGERCNVAGSRKFLRLIKEGNYEEALSIARKQVDDGAQVIDINMDDGMLDAVKEMTTFLNLIASEPDIARVPVMIDSSKWNVIEQALMCTQGKSIVNSISLKEGEETFLRQASRIKQLGAAVVVMAFDEKGQADIFERKTAVCERAYKLLIDKVGFNPQDIIFDPNVLAIATGMEEHNRYGLDFIQAVEWIKQHLPGAKVSGGVSNLSFSFRGNNYVREAMHAVFLYHAIGKGMDMGIVNPSSSILYEDIEPSFRTLLEDVILYRRPGAAEELIAYAQNLQKEVVETTDSGQEVWRTSSLQERLEYALQKGIGDFLETDLAEALRDYPRAVDIIDGPLMSGMNKVGELFGAGKMFLPQVVKTARTMKKAVAILQPAIEAEKTEAGSTKAGTVVFATVKGDVHDIGKNIVSIVLSCNNYDVIDLGVMVPADVIIKKAIEVKPDLICLSGLITPSLDEMVHVTDELEKAGLTIPVMIGGATTSKLHTAVKIAPNHSFPIIHVLDASQNPLIAAKLLHPETRQTYLDELNKEYESLRASMKEKKEELVSLEEARKHPVRIDWKSYHPVKPAQSGVQVIPYISIEEIRPYIHWNFFFAAWKLSGRFAGIAGIDGCDVCRANWLADFPEEDRAKAAEAMQLYKDANRLLNKLEEMKAEYCKAIYCFLPANSDQDNIVLENGTLLPMLRQQSKNKDNIYKSLADYLLPLSEGRTDYIGAFVVSAGVGADYLRQKFEAEGDTYSSMLLQTLTDRMAEATAEYLHQKVRREFWGYAPDESLSISDLFRVKYQGIRPAIGYPSLPDQLLNVALDELLSFSQIGVSLTENGAMHPTASVSGLYFAHLESAYFMIGTIDDEQVADYAQRRKVDKEDILRFLNKNIRP